MRFNTSIKWKIIIIFLLGSVALIGSYFVNKLAFGEIQRSVGDLSYTNKKLFLVNKLFFEVNESEQSFRNLSNNDHSVESFLVQSGTIGSFSDSLRLLCKDNRYQNLLIDSISNLLKTREKLLLDYVAFRRSIKSNNSLILKTRILDSIITADKTNADSLVLTQEKRKTITTTDSVVTQEEQERKGFWNRIFKAKKKEPKTVKTTIEEQTDTQTDTIVQTQKNAFIAEAQKIITEIGREQRARRKTFLTKEAALAEFENTFYNNIASLLSEIEKDITGQTNLTHDRAAISIQKSMNGIYFIIAGFLLFALVIVALMLGDVTKAHRYRLLLEKAREEAEESSRSRQRFLSNMSHEIRTPLQSIIGYTEQISQQQVPDKTHLSAVQNAAGHLLQVINEILDYSRINSGILVFERNDFEVVPVVEEVAGILRQQANDKGIALLVDQDCPAGERVTGDAFRLRQVLLNLVGNAIKFTEKGSVRVRVTHENVLDELRYTFRISDTGIGIPLHMQEQIFDQFEQGTVAPEHRYKGTGLGLSIAKALVTGQGGSIAVESEEDKGTCFTFSIGYDMAANARAMLMPVAKPPEPAAPYTGTVWLVDDDQLILRLCSGILDKKGIRHECFDSAEVLLRNTHNAAPSMILMDIRMPGINGLQLFDKVKSIWPDRPVMVAMTSQALPEEREEMMTHGFDRLLLKPFREQELLALFDEAASNEPEPLPGNHELQLNMQVLERMFPDEPDEVRQILRAYLSETRSDLARLKEARMRDDTVETMIMIVHRLAGRTGQIGAVTLGTSLRRQELALRNGQVPAATDALDAIVENLEQLLQEIEHRMDHA